jgi:hypothetical protein
MEDNTILAMSKLPLFISLAGSIVRQKLLEIDEFLMS